MSRRKLTFLRKLLYLCAGRIISLWLSFVWLSSRVTINNDAALKALLTSGKVIIPCFWHNQLFICSYYTAKLRKYGLKPGFLISPSMDGELAVNVIKHWQAHAIRGSSTRTGAQAIRDLYLAIKQKGISPANTPDGPNGPVYQAKPGVIMLTQSTGAPIIPMACAYKRAWAVNSWDRLLIPKPFNHIVIEIGSPFEIEKKIPPTETKLLQNKLENTLNTLQLTAAEHLGLHSLDNPIK